MIMMVKRAGEREKKKKLFFPPPPSLGSTTREGRGGREKSGMADGDDRAPYFVRDRDVGQKESERLPSAGRPVKKHGSRRE